MRKQSDSGSQKADIAESNRINPDADEDDEKMRDGKHRRDLNNTAGQKPRKQCGRQQEFSHTLYAKKHLKRHNGRYHRR